VEHLITKHPQDVSANGGYYVRPLAAALAREHFQTADLLRHNGADLHVQGRSERNPLHGAAYSGNFEVVQIIIGYDPAFINAGIAGGEDGLTPLFWASDGLHFTDGSILRLLLYRGADINIQSENGWVPLHCASLNGALEIARLLLEHGADVEAKDNDGETALQVTANRGYDEVV
jgi:ankyrin repeat protein